MGLAKLSQLLVRELLVLPRLLWDWSRLLLGSGRGGAWGWVVPGGEEACRGVLEMDTDGLLSFSQLF